MKKKELISLLRKWGNGNLKGVAQELGICLNLYRLDKADTEFQKFILLRPYRTVTCTRTYPVGGNLEYGEDVRLGTLWTNTRRLKMCRDFADWLEETEE